MLRPPESSSPREKRVNLSLARASERDDRRRLAGKRRIENPEYRDYFDKRGRLRRARPGSAPRSCIKTVLDARTASPRHGS
jgi:hypothetical protein